MNYTKENLFKYFQDRPILSSVIDMLDKRILELERNQKGLTLLIEECKSKPCNHDGHAASTGIPKASKEEV